MDEKHVQAQNKKLRPTGNRASRRPATKPDRRCARETALAAADVLAKLVIVEEEADESMYWMEMLVDSGALRNGQAEKLLGEADGIIAMTVASIKTPRKRSAGP